MFKSLPRRALLWAPLLAVLLTPNAFAAGGASAGKVSYSDLSVMISLEKASALFKLAVAAASTSTRWSSRSARPPASRRKPATTSGRTT